MGLDDVSVHPQEHIDDIASKQVIEVKKSDIPSIVEEIDKAFFDFFDFLIRELTKEE